jgi:hypothetical protein
MTKGVEVGVRVGVGTGVCVGVRVLVRVLAGVPVFAADCVACADVVGVARAEPPHADAAATASTTRMATNAEPRLLLRISSHLA